MTGGYLASFAMLGVSRSFLGPSLLKLSENTGTRLAGISFLFVVLGLGNMGGNWLGGKALDRFSGNRVLTITLAITGLLLGISSLMPNLWLLSTAMLLLGFCFGALENGGNTLMMWLHHDKSGPYLSALYMFTGLGSLVTPAIIGQFLEHTGNIGPSYWVLGLIALPGILMLFRIPGPVAQKPALAANRTVVDRGMVAFIILLYFLCVGSQALFSGWVFTYAVKLNLASELSASYLTSAYWTAQAVGLLLSIYITARLRPQIILIGNLGCGLLSLSAILIFPASVAALWAGTIGLGLAMAPLFPAAFTLVGQRMQITGRVNGWFLASASAGAMTLPWVAGQIIEATNVSVMVACSTTALFTAFILLILYLSTTARKSAAKNE